MDKFDGLKVHKCQVITVEKKNLHRWLKEKFNVDVEEKPLGWAEMKHLLESKLNIDIEVLIYDTGMSMVECRYNEKNKEEEVK